MAVELAIILPFLFLLIVSILDLGLLMQNHQILQNAAREGARLAVLPKNWIDARNPDGGIAEDRIKNRIVEYCASENLPIGLADINVDQNYPVAVGARTAMSTRIRVTFQHSFITPGATDLAGGPTQLVGEAVFRNLF